MIYTMKTLFGGLISWDYPFKEMLHSCLMVSCHSPIVSLHASPASTRDSSIVLIFTTFILLLYTYSSFLIGNFTYTCACPPPEMEFTTTLQWKIRGLSADFVSVHWKNLWIIRAFSYCTLVQYQHCLHSMFHCLSAGSVNTTAISSLVMQLRVQWQL